MTIRIERASVDDLKAIDQCNRANLAENYDEEFLKMFLMSSGTCVLVARVSDDKENLTPIIGYVMCMAKKDKHQRLVGYVFSIAVYEEFRRRKIGQKLLQSAEEELVARYGANLKQMTLHRRKKNSEAAKFYAKMGYNPGKLIKDYYVNPNDSALLLCKQM